MHILSLQSVFKVFVQDSFESVILRSVNVNFKQGQTYAITGSSGCGKSTLLHILAGLELPDKGNVLFDGFAVTHMTKDQKQQWLNEKIGLVFQLPYLINELSVIENVMLKGFVRGQDKKQSYERAALLLNQMHLYEKKNAEPRSLSGGQQQRVAIARALFKVPAFFLADEPTGNLDPTNAQAILHVLLEYQKEYTMGLIISSHDRYITQQMNTVLTLKDGILV